MFRWHVVSAVFWRNVKQYFSGPLGYLFIVVFVTVCFPVVAGRDNDRDACLRPGCHPLEAALGEPRIRLTRASSELSAALIASNVR